MHLADPDTQPQFYASVAPKRFLAWVIDTIIVVVLCVIIVPFTGFLGLFVFSFLLLVVGFLYRLMTIASGSATWGMRMMAIELRAADGGRFDTSLAFWHTLGYSISWAFPILQVISIVLMVISPRGQGLTDHILGSTMLNKRAT